jgi:two-component system sensor histidine kinase UhpB
MSRVPTTALPNRMFPQLLRSIGLAVLYAISWQFLLLLSQVLWFLPAGLRLGALWVNPSRRWPWLAAGEWLGLIVFSLIHGRAIFTPTFFAVGMLPWLVYAAVVWVVRGSSGESRVDQPRQMLLLIGTGLACAALVSPLLSHYLPGTDAAQAGSLAGTFGYLYRGFIGQLVFAPLLVLSLRPDLRERLHLALWLDIGAQTLISLSVFAVLKVRPDLASFLLMLAFAPIFFVSFRQGWEGAALSVAITGLLLELWSRLQLVPIDVTVLQLALSVVGAGGLTLGAASSALRRSHRTLAHQHRELAQAHEELRLVAAELRSVSQRLVRLEEQGQRELAGEIEYELGQAIHALGTRISLAFRDTRDEHMVRLLESVREQVREMQESLRRLMRQLRPPALDSHGLREAIGHGPLRDMLDDAGIEFETALYGRVEALDDDAQTAVYRICQAAVRSTTEMSSVRRLRIKLDVRPGYTQTLQVEIQIDIEVSPFLEYPLEPHPLPAIADRVLAQEGSYLVTALNPGLRHLVHFENHGSGMI